MVALVALFTGMRLGEVLALRWNRVDLDCKVLKVREALEQTKAHGLRFKRPKTKAGRRNITLPVMLVGVLRAHRKAMLEQALQLGTGRLADDALLFAGAGRRAAVTECGVGGVGALCRQHRPARSDVPRVAPHPRLAVDRRPRGYRHHLETAGPRQAGHDATHLRSPVQEGRWQGCGGDQCGTGSVTLARTMVRSSAARKNG
jgi:integrase